jgi:hypothetical protein
MEDAMRSTEGRRGSGACPYRSYLDRFGGDDPSGRAEYRRRTDTGVPHTGNILSAGAGAALKAEYKISGTEYGGFPPL